MFAYKTIEMPEFLRRFIIFCGVGVFNTLIGFLFIMFFYKILGFYYLIANFLGYMLSVLVGYATHRNITFRDKKTAEKEIRTFVRHFRKFSLVFTVSYLIQLLSLFVMVDFLNFWVVPSQIIAMGIYVIVSYIGTTFFAFKKV